MSRHRALAGLAGLWLLFALLGAGSEAVRRTRTGEWLRYWGKTKLTRIEPEHGFAYVASLGRSDLSSHEAKSPARLLENGVAWSAGNDQHADIRQIGHGRFSFWHDTVYFSASDNSDPRTNGRIYRIHYPLIGAGTARVVHGAAVLCLAAALLATGRALRSGVLAPDSRLLLRLVRIHGPSVLVALSAAALVLVAVLRAAPGPPERVDAAWLWVIGLNLVAAWVLRARYARTIPTRVAVAFLVALAAGYFMLTVLAPHRAQRCHTTLEQPAWEVFCVSGDSASYYVGYFPGSTRNPLYPWFIKVATWGTGFDAGSYIPTHTEMGRPITDSADPLFRVVRLQILFLLGASLAACFSLMRLLGSPLPAAALLWLYDQQFFTAFELNVVLTEDLVQALLFLLLAAFLGFLRAPRPWLLHAGAILCGLAYLTRQAAGYCLIFLAVMMLWALVHNWRRSWRSCLVAGLVALALVVLPDVYAFAKLGNLRRQQENLQYQYRIGHAMQYAEPEDVALMPDDAARRWLAEAIALRDREHAEVDRTYPPGYERLVQYIYVNLYHVATPPGSSASPQFLMKVANPILARHWTEYLRFGLRFWQFGVSWPGLARTGVAGFSPWLTYAALWLLVLWLRDRYAVAGVTLIVGHWLHVLVASFFAAPIARMVWASELLVPLAGLLLLSGAVERAACAARRRAEPLAP